MHEAEPRQHHYIPRSLIERFANEQGQVFALRKGGEIFLASPEKIFRVRDLNTSSDRDGNRDSSLETSYSRLEGQMRPIAAKIINFARRSKRPELLKAERQVLNDFFYRQLVRVPLFDEHHGIRTDAEEKYESFMAWFEENVRPMTDDERNDMRSESTKAQVLHNARIVAQGAIPTETMAFLSKVGIAIGRALEGEFALGSFPTVRLPGPGFNGSADWCAEFWLPLSPDIAISPGYRTDEERIINFDGAKVATFNRLLWAQSDMVACRTKAIIEAMSVARA